MIPRLIFSLPRLLSLSFFSVLLSSSQLALCQDSVEYALRYAAHKRYDEAFAEINRGLKSHPEDTANILLNRGFILATLGRNKEALRDEEDAILLFKQKPSERNALAVAYANRAAVLKKLHQERNAFNSYKCALKANPKDAQANESLAVMLAARRKLQQARAHLKTAKETYIACHDQQEAARIDDQIAKLDRGESLPDNESQQ